MIERTNVCRQAWQNHERVSEWAKERREWMNEWMNEQTDGWFDKWINNFARCLSRVGANSKLFFYMKSKPPPYGLVSRLFILLCKDSESCEELMSDKRNTDSFL